MKQLNARTIAIYAGLGIAGLSLLLLVTPSLTGAIGFHILVAVFSILPLIAIVALATLIFGTSKSQPARKVNRKWSVTLGIAAATTILSVVITYLSTNHVFSLSRTQFVLENTGVALLFLAYTCTLTLMNQQRFIYWPFWNRHDKQNSDERQMTVRNRVYEKAYVVNLLAIVAAALLVRVHSQRLHDELYQAGILCLLGLPTIIASWQKDS